MLALLMLACSVLLCLLCSCVCARALSQARDVAAAGGADGTGRAQAEMGEIEWGT